MQSGLQGRERLNGSLRIILFAYRRILGYQVSGELGGPTSRAGVDSVGCRSSSIWSSAGLPSLDIASLRVRRRNFSREMTPPIHVAGSALTEDGATNRDDLVALLRTEVHDLSFLSTHEAGLPYRSFPPVLADKQLHRTLKRNPALYEISRSQPRLRRSQRQERNDFVGGSFRTPVHAPSVRLIIESNR